MISIAVMANLHDGRSESLSLDLQTRHGDSRRPLTLMGALPGLPAEGVGRDYGLDRRGRLSPSLANALDLENSGLIVLHLTFKISHTFLLKFAHIAAKFIT
ncbi:MAG: hypothetical protein AAF583_03345 [Pseudomonadota bacterium]